MKTYLLSIGLLLVVGCQALHTKPTEVFYLKNEQTTHLKIIENLEARLFNSAPPLITEDKIITGNAQDGVRAFDTNGNEVWKKEVEAGIEGGFAYKDNRLYFGANNYMFYSLNLESGIEVWHFKTEGEVLSKPLLVNDRLYFVTGNNILYCLKAKDGSLIWRYKRNTRDIFTVRGAATPVISQNRLFVGFSDGFFTAININNGSLLWERNLATSIKFKDVDASAVVDGDTIYVSAYDSALYALNNKEGRVLWSVDAGGSYPVAVVGNKIYYSTSDSRLLVIEKQTGRITSEMQAKGIFQTALVKDNLLFLADSAGSVKTYDTNTDKMLKEFYPGHGVSSPLVSPDNSKSIYFLSFGANLFHLTYGWKPDLGVY
ncbi:MAG: PQQ-binding-like beta-propeller repeat protein [Bdellovibrionales bacterium]|nr:PQQ-binding-like beta-propeller repeat protein [Bdellovibrionales bacterium]